MSGERPIPVLRCSAAGVPLGLAAEEVAEFSAYSPGAPSLARLLGLPEQPADGDRTLRLDCRQGHALVQVEGPVRIRSVASGDLLRVPRLLAVPGMAPVIGFLEEAGQVVVLLDVGRLVQLARAATGDNERDKEPSPC